MLDSSARKRNCVARLYPPDELDALANDLPVMAKILAWVREFLAKAHPDLGRSGPVCPFIPLALSLNTVWLLVVRTQMATVEQIEESLGPCRERFLQIEPLDENAINKAILMIFPDVAVEKAPLLIDGVKKKTKAAFVQEGLMIGEFHELNPGGGLHNPDFRPLRSPVPMLVIRHMVMSDLPFLMRGTDSAEERVVFLQAYLARFGSSLDAYRADLASAALVSALKGLQG